MRYGRLGPFIVLAILIMGSSSIFATLAKPSDKEEFLCYSKRAANWLLALGQEDNTGLRWPYHEGKADAFATSFYSGSAGVTLYFLNLYKVTGDALYLETAKKAAAGLMADAIQNKDGYRWLEVDEKDDGQRYRTVYAGLYLGAAGIGAVFLALNQVEPRVEYLQYAVGAAAWILAAAKKPYADYSWGGGTDIISGGAGIGLFLLRVHEATGDDKYLTAAVELGDWLVSRSEQDGKGLKWRPTSSMDSYYSGFAHGTAGVAYYLIELFQATQERKYLDAAEGGARWLMDRAKTTGSGLKWSRREPDQKDQYMDGWCNGAAGIGRFFLRLHRVTGRLEYLETAVKAGKWIRLVSYPVDQNRRYNIGSMCCGASGVGDYFLDLYLATGDPGYLEFAAKLGKGIAHVGVTRKDKSKWLHYSDSRGTYYASGFNQGAAGIGYFLLRLYAAQKGLISRMVYFPDSDVFDMWVLK